MKMKKRSLKLMSALGIVAALAMTFAGCGNNNLPELIVDDPVIAVADADEDGKVSVTLSCNTKEARLFYSIDGTDPSTEYSAPITLSPVAEEKTYTVKAQAKKNGYTSSKVVEKTVKVDAAEKEVVTYTVTFDSDGGTEIDDVTANEGTPIAEPTAPTKTGYTFTGWYNGETKYDFISNVTSDLTLKAKWTINTYTVTFDTDGGSTIDSITVDYNTTATQPATNPTKTGYTFAGWKLGETAYDFETLVTADVTIKAEWTINTYTITFDSDGGSTVESITVNYNTTATQPAEPSKDDAYFAGWVDAEGNSFQFTTPITDNITLKATWTTDPVYTVTVNPNYDGASTTSVYATIDTEYKVTLSAPSRTGYTFAGWTTDAAGTTAADFTVAISNNTTTFYAQWQTASFTVTFDVDGTTTPVTVNYGETINDSDIPSPRKTGYTFAGWKNGEVAFDVTTATITSNVTLTATWTINKYTVTLDIDGNTSKLAENVEHGTPVAAPATTPTKTGYTFAGWKVGETAYDFATAVTADITLTAAWNVVTYSITYFLNDGTNADGAATTYNIETNDITLATPTKDANKFRGWYETEDFTGTVTTTIAKGSTGNKTYYAKWYEFKTYTVTLENVTITFTEDGNKYKGEALAAAIPDNVDILTGDIVRFTLKGIANKALTNLRVQVIDNTKGATAKAYWGELSEAVEIASNFAADTLITTEEVSIEITDNPNTNLEEGETAAKSKKLIFWAETEEGAKIYGSQADRDDDIPGTTYDYIIQDRQLEFKIDSNDGDNIYKIKLSDIVTDTLKKNDIVNVTIKGVSTKAISELQAQIVDKTQAANWHKPLSNMVSKSVAANEEFNLTFKFSITDKATGEGPSSQTLILQAGDVDAKVYKNLEALELGETPAPELTYSIIWTPAENSAGVLAHWNNPFDISGNNFASASTGAKIKITYEEIECNDCTDNYKQMKFKNKWDGTDIVSIYQGTVTGGILDGEPATAFAPDLTRGTLVYAPTDDEWQSIKENSFIIEGHKLKIAKVELGIIVGTEPELTESANLLSTPISLDNPDWPQPSELKFHEMTTSIDAKKIQIEYEPLSPIAEYASLKVSTWKDDGTGTYVETPVSCTASVTPGNDGAYGINKNIAGKLILTLNSDGSSTFRYGDVQFYGYGVTITSIKYFY